MSEARPVIAYVASQLPKRSETFVYREVLGLRQRGYAVVVVSVNPPEAGLDDARLEALSAEARVVYCAGWWWRGAVAALRRPGVFLGAVRDALTDGDVRGVGGRLKVVVQVVAALALADDLRAGGVTHVHAHMAHVPTTVAMYAAAALRVPFSFTGHAADLFRDRAMLKRKLGRASFVACISQWHRAFYRSLHDANDAHYPVIRCGVPTPEVDPPPPEGGPRSDGGAREVLTVGRLVPKKGFDTLIDAWAKLGDAARNVTLTIVGDGPQEAALRDQVARHGLGECVTLAGAMGNDAVRERMLRSTLFVLPCKPADDGDRDGIPVVLMEAMAAGRCVVSGDLPAIRELVEAGVTGRLVPPGDADALAAVLNELLADDAQRARLAAGGRQRVLDEFSLPITLDRLEACFARR